MKNIDWRHMMDFKFTLQLASLISIFLTTRIFMNAVDRTPNFGFRPPLLILSVKKHE